MTGALEEVSLQFYHLELIIDSCSYEFDPCFEVLDKNQTLKIIISINKRGKVFFLNITSLITILIQLLKTIIFCV